MGSCLLYTSDAADDSLRVDLGGRRIIKKHPRRPLRTQRHPRLTQPGDPPPCHGFFKQKTAYEIHERLVGSEMCIRDRREEEFSEVDIESNFSILYLASFAYLPFGYSSK